MPLSIQRQERQVTMKSGRQNAIRKIIEQQKIETQQQLSEALAKMGIDSAQATLSRDIRELKLIKQHAPDGSMFYILPETQETPKQDDTLRSFFRQSVVSVDTAQNLIVIHTYPGLASAACAALDGMEIEGMVGTLAGDDTAFVAMKNKEAAESLAERIHELG